MLWGRMFQGGDRHLQCPCGGFDSHRFHQVYCRIAQIVVRRAHNAKGVGASPTAATKLSRLTGVKRLFYMQFKVGSIPTESTKVLGGDTALMSRRVTGSIGEENPGGGVL